MNKLKTFALLAIFASLISADMPAYKIYTVDGTASSFDQIIASAIDADVVLFGELHNNAIAHWLQLELVKGIYKSKKDIVLGAEMFEADDQIKIDEYFDDLISTGSFENECRLWGNYKTDYKPLLEFAKSNKLKFVACNIPRRYASFVAKKGLDSLKMFSKEARDHIAPLPIAYDAELPGYKAMAGMAGHGMNYIAEAQAAKDATMAHFILDNLKKGQTFIHFNGAYHSNNFEGINWYLKEAKKKIKIVTISTVEQADVNSLMDDNKNLADYIIVVDEDVTKTN